MHQTTGVEGLQKVCLFSYVVSFSFLSVGVDLPRSDCTPCVFFWVPLLFALHQGRMHTPGHPGHGPGFGPIFFHFAVASTSGFRSIAQEGLGSIAEEE